MGPDLLKGVDPYVEPSFSLRNRLRRLVWGVAWTLLFRPSPNPFFGYRAALLRMFGARIGRDCHVYNDVRIWAPWNLVMADRSGLGPRTICYSMGLITLANDVVVSQGAHLCAGTHDFEDPLFQLITAPITIGARAWICAEAFVGPGVTVGEGAVVGARAVAMKDVPAWTVCAGNPCRPIKPRVLRNP